MKRKRALVICEEPIINEVVKFVLDKVSYEVELVDNPKDAVSRIETNSYEIVVIGKNKGTVVKPKLAEIIYNKSSVKPYIIIYKDPGEVIQREPYILTLPKPTFHEELLEALKKAGFKPSATIQSLNIDIDEFVKSTSYKIEPVHEFFRNLKGNTKFLIKAGNSKVVGFTMGTDLYILYSDLDNPYSILNLGGVNISTEQLELSEFLDLPIDSKTFKINIRDFIVKCIENINDRDVLLSFIPSLEYSVVVKAPAYVVNQIELIGNNIDVDSLMSQEEVITLDDILKDKTDIKKLKAIVCMYLLNMVDVKPMAQGKRKYDVKIKKSFLKKIIDKIRGL